MHNHRSQNKKKTRTLNIQDSVLIIMTISSHRYSNRNLDWIITGLYSNGSFEKKHELWTFRILFWILMTISSLMFYLTRDNTCPRSPCCFKTCAGLILIMFNDRLPPPPIPSPPICCNLKISRSDTQATSPPSANSTISGKLGRY